MNSTSEDDPQLHHSFADTLEEFKAGVDRILREDGIDLNPQQELDQNKILWRLRDILDEYQEESYLLDSHLDQLLSPVIHQFQLTVSSSLASTRLKRIAKLIYYFTKVRGGKVITRLFSHDTHDLVTLLALFSDPATLEATSWETRYILLLWLSLVSMLPFALSSLDNITPRASTSKEVNSNSRIEEIGFRYLACSSKERNGAVALLSRFESRQDAHLADFLSNCDTILNDSTSSVYLLSGIAQTICEIVKIASAPTLLSVWPQLSRLRFSCTSLAKQKNGSMMSKYRIKLTGRLASLQLPLQSRNNVVSEQVEEMVEELLEAVEHKETIVRWSAAKYLARIAERLPRALSQQIVESIFEIFDDAAPFTEETTLEYAWQGGCYTLAEFARRGLISEELIGMTLDRVIRALHFDHKRGVQSIGIGVRDSAAYVLWSLARTIAPSQATAYASQLAIHLVSVALFDREIQIRRAASAAFQESVGRLGVLPHGIDVLRKIDFFTVSIRKKAFLEAAPLVAEHESYRTALIDHLVETGLSHYDPEMRVLSAEALASIALVDCDVLISRIVHRQIAEMRSKDMIQLHGILLSLGYLARASLSMTDVADAESIRLNIFLALAFIDLKQLTTTSSTLILSAALLVIEHSCTIDGMQLGRKEDWWRCIQIASQSTDEDLHRAAGKAMGRISTMTELIESLESRVTTQVVSGSLILGCIDYTGLNLPSKARVIDRLILISSVPKSSVEAIRNGIESLTSITLQTDRDLVPYQFDLILSTIIRGLDNYTTDQRGDVGSWVRLISIKSLAALLSKFWTSSSQLLSQTALDIIVGGLLKLGVERLDSVREAVGNVLEEIALQGESSELKLRGRDMFEDLRRSATSNWRDYGWSTKTLLPFLGVPEYRSRVLDGALISATAHAHAPLLEYTLSLPSSAESSESGPYTRSELMEDLYEKGRLGWSLNTIFIPFLTVMGNFSDEGAEVLGSIEVDLLKRIVILAMKSIKSIKSAPRLMATCTLMNNLLRVGSIKPFVVAQVGILLRHPLPWVRKHVVELVLHDAIEDRKFNTESIDEEEIERFVSLL